MQFMQDSITFFTCIFMSVMLVNEIRLHVLRPQHALFTNMVSPSSQALPSTPNLSIPSRIMGHLFFGHYSFALLIIICAIIIKERQSNLNCSREERKRTAEHGFDCTRKRAGEITLNLCFLLAAAIHIMVRFVTTKGDYQWTIMTANCTIGAITVQHRKLSLLFVLMPCLWLGVMLITWDVRGLLLKLAPHLFSKGEELDAWIAFFSMVRSYTFQEFLFSHILESIPLHLACVRRAVDQRRSDSKVKRKERELLEQESAIEAIVNNLPALVWQVDSNLVMTFCRGAVLNDIQVSQGASEGLPIDKALMALKVPDEYVPLNVQRHVDALKGEKIFFLYKTPLLPDTVYRCFLIPLRNREGKVHGCVGISIDITDLVNAQQAVHDSEENYRLLVETINELIIKIDTNFKIEFINHDFLGIPKKALIGRSFLEFFANNPTQSQKIRQQLGQLFSVKESSSWDWSSNDYSQRADGDVNFFSSVANVIRKNDQVTGAIIITANTTEKVRSQEQQRMVQEERVASRSKSEFISQMSHEIRNPLNAIMGSLQLLCLSRDNLTCIQQEHLSDATENAKLLLTIVSDILDLSKIESGKIDIVLEPANILEMVETTVNMFTSQTYERKLQLYSYVDPKIPLCLICDRNRIAQILMNFTSNAAKFTHRGSITLTATLLEQTATSASIRFECIDTGIGIRKCDQKKIFEPFVQIVSKNQNFFGCAYKGWGLGLQISSRLAKLMKGSVGVQSDLGKGSTFFFEVTLSKLQSCASITNRINSLPITHFLPEIFYDHIAVVGIQDELYQILGKYLRDLRVKSVELLDSEEQLSQYVDQLDSHERVAIIVSADYEQLERVNRTSSSRRKVILLEDHFHGHEGTNHNTLRLPLKLENLSAMLSRNMEVALPPLGNSVPKSHLDMSPDLLRILYVEDNPINRKIMLFLLNKLQIKNIDFAENGKEGLEKVSNSDQGYSIVFMDLNMPIMDGQTAAAKIRKLPKPSHSNSPIVAVTANAEATSIHMLSQFFGDVVVKPVSIEKIVDMINKHARPASPS